ncbi:MAG: CoA ester lyase [Pseudomonadota bacterium]
MRSLLFVPGSRPDRIAKALAAGADAVCVDLEDAVAPDAKAEARSAVIEALKAGGGFGVRVNALRTAWGCADVAALAEAGAAPDFIMIPKADHPVEVELVGQALDHAAPLIPVIESAVGLDAASWTCAVKGVSAALFGGGDYSADLCVEMEWEALFHARATVANACAAAGVAAIDVPYLDVKDETGLASETRRVKALGYTAKACIHPAQISTVNAVFTPSAAELDEARAVIAALDDAGGGAALLNGKLIEAPIIRRARRVLRAAG